MSAMSPDGTGSAFAATTAGALLNELTEPRWAGRRLLLRGLHGLAPAALFEALLAGATTRQVEVYPEGTSRPSTTLTAVLPGGVEGNEVIPFLVEERGATPNSGTGGFAASLRTHFLEGTSRPRILLILAAKPQETIASTTEDAAALPALAFDRLCKESVLPPAGGPQPSPLVRSVVDHHVTLLQASASTSWREAERLRDWVGAHGNDPDTALGAALHELRTYISDPDLRAASAARRLAKAASWRADLEQWISSPGVDLARRLAAKRVSQSGVDAVLAARSVRGLDWARFSLQDLQSRGSRTELDLDPVNPVSGATIALINGDSVALWLPARGGTIQFKLTRALERGEQARLRWRSEPAANLPGRGTTVTASVASPSPGEWRFGWLELLEGGATTARYAIAAAFRDGDVVAFEDSIEVDADLGGFTCAETPRLAAWSRDGRKLGNAVLDAEPDATEDVARVHQVTGTIDGIQVGPVPVVPSRSGGEEDGEESAPPDSGSGSDEDPGAAGADEDEGPDQSGEGGEQPDDDLLGGAASGRGELPARDPKQPTLAHAMLAFGQPRWPDTPSAPSGEEAVSARFGAVELEVRPQVDGVALLPVERAILEHPEWCMFTVEGDSCSLLRAFPRPEPGWSRELEAFLDARARFFAEALRIGSAYALDPRSEVATDYTASYRALLQALPREATSRTEYDDLLLVDRVEVRGNPDLLIAPTSPLTVAWHAALARRFQALAEAGAGADRADVTAFTPQFLLPLLLSEGDWYEAQPAGTALLWRRYAPLATASPGALERNAAFIASRIAFFLSVHPALDTPETTLAVTFAEPGDGESAIGALRHFYRPDRSRSEYRRPRIRAAITGAGRPARQAINELLSGAADNDLDRIVRTRSDLSITDDLAPPAFSSIAFLFRSPGSRGVRPVRLDQRASTSYARGLAAAPGRVLVPDADYVFATGTFCDAPGHDATDLEAIQYRSLELVGGQGGERLEPGWTRMVTATAAESDLASWYDRSGWVVHLDRLVGLEALANGQSHRTVLEYEEGADPATFGYDGITGTRHVDPYLAALRRALAGVASPSREQARELMRVLESVSGRWALQIVQRPLEKVLERAGTACSVRYLQEVEQSLVSSGGGFSALVALEEIVPGFPESGIPRRLLSSRKGRGAMCDDLLLLAVTPRDGQPPLIQATVIEVKFWAAAGADYSDAADQVEDTIGWLRSRFGSPGALADLRGRDLAELIRSARARNGTFGPAPALPAGAEQLLQRISSGEYELQFGHWRRDAYRRGLIVAVENGQAGAMQLSQLNGVEGPIDLVTLRSGFAVPALEMQSLGAPPGWARLSMRPPAAEPGSGGGAPGPAAGPPEPGKGSTTSPDRDGPRGASVTGQPSAAPGVPATEGEGVTDELLRDARRLGEAFAKYGLTVEPFEPSLAQVGPSVIRFRTRAVGRLSITDVERRSRDISREVGASGEVGIGDEPGFITVDVPRTERQPVPLPVALQALDTHQGKPGALSFVAGLAPSGDVRIADLSRLPHLLVAGATGSGKSVFLRGLLVELLRARTPEQLELVIIDPKRLDFSAFTRAPHLRGGTIISDPQEALQSLDATLAAELERRQPILEEAGVSSAAEFYEVGGALEDLPQLVILVDEFADLVLAGHDRRAFSEMVQRYAQLTRAYGIFLVLATQRPSVDVVTGSIKANLTARMAFSLPSSRDSMTILDRGGAEDLLGDGDLLFYRNGKIERLQAPLTTIADVRATLGLSR
ncbi:FtsK/SpoIIIE domain-containing protein [Modestobacter sp. SYSU DS0511]